MSIFDNPLYKAPGHTRPSSSKGSRNGLDATLREDSEDTEDVGYADQAESDVNSQEEDEQDCDTGQSTVESSTDGSRTRHSKQQQRRNHRSLRYRHLDVLVTLVHRCTLDHDWKRAERAYSLLLRCPGVDIRLCYELGLDILDHVDTTGSRSADFLYRLIVAYPPLKSRQGKKDFDRADKFVKLWVANRMKHGDLKRAMQDLDGWLLAPPYKDDRELWRDMALICAKLKLQAHKSSNEIEAERLQRKCDKAVAMARGQDLMLDD